MNYLYYLTPRGFKLKTSLALNYLKKLSKEYEELKKEVLKK